MTLACVVVVSACDGGAELANKNIQPPSSVAASDESGAVVVDSRKARSATLFPNRFGFSQTLNANGGPINDPTNPFFQSLGANGRSCSTCHVPEAGMTITPEVVRERFRRTAGQDPLFRTNDGSNSPQADVSTVAARAAAYSMLLDRAVIRVGVGISDTAEFELLSAEDPYGYATAHELSLFRRPLASTNVRFLSTVMWDGRETFKDPTQPSGFATLHFDLSDQSNSATVGHAAAAAPLTTEQREAIVGFEMNLFTAQSWDFGVGGLNRHGGQGGPEALVNQEFYFGINDALGGDPTGKAFDPTVMTLYTRWAADDGDEEENGGHGRRARREAIARGEDLFNHKSINIVDVAGLNDDLGLPTIGGTCTTCHDTPNSGNHSVPAPLRIGTDLPNPVGGLNVTGLPVYTLRNKTTGEIQTTTDPGRALITGKWKDVGRFKGPILRGIASRAPYFHNGSAATLEDVISFYDRRFSLGLTVQEKSDLLAFLAAL